MAGQKIEVMIITANPKEQKLFSAKKEREHLNARRSSRNIMSATYLEVLSREPRSSVSL